MGSWKVPLGSRLLLGTYNALDQMTRTFVTVATRNNHYSLPLGTVSSMCLLTPVSCFLLQNLRPLDPCGRMRPAAGGLCARESLKQRLGFSSFPGEEARRRRVRTGASSLRRPLLIVSDFCLRSTW